MKADLFQSAMAAVLIFISTSAKADTITQYTPPAGDAIYSWNSRYGNANYGVGDTSIGIYLYMGGSYGNDYTIGIFEVPIASLVGKTLLNATLEVNSTGFGTNYYYGSAYLGWLDVGLLTPTGNVVTDALGGPSTSLPNNWTIYNSDLGNGGAGIKTFDVASYVQSDLNAGRLYSTFVLHGSRETWGSILSGENGITGPRIVAETAVPEPAAIAMIVIGGLLIIGFRNRRKSGS